MANYVNQKSVKISEYFRKIIKVIEQNNQDTSNNLKFLVNEVEDIQARVLRNANTKYKEANHKINQLRKVILTKQKSIDNHSFEMTQMKIDKHINYTREFIDLKNDLFVREMDNMQDMVSELDSYILNIYNKQKTLLDIIYFNYNRLSLDDATTMNLVEQTLLSYKEKLKAVNNNLDESFTKYEYRTKELYDAYFVNQDKFLKKLSSSDLSYQDKITNFLKDHLPLSVNETEEYASNIFKQNHDYITSCINDLKEKFEERKRKIIEEFKSNTEVLKQKFSIQISKELVGNEDLYKDYEEVLLENKNDIIKSFYDQNKKDLKKNILLFEKIYSKKQLLKKLENRVKEEQHIYYLSTIELLKKNEKEYLKELALFKKNHLLFRYVLRKMPFSASIEDEVLRTKNYDSVAFALNEKIHNDLDSYLENQIFEYKMTSSLDQLAINLNYDIKKANINFQIDLYNDYEKMLSSLMTNYYTSEKVKIENNYLLNVLPLYMQKDSNDFKYHYNLLNITKNYINSKAHTFMSLALFNKKVDEEMHPFRSTLILALKRYDIIVSNFNTLFENELLYLNENKSRQELNNLINHEYIVKAFENQSNTALITYENATNEYQIKLTTSLIILDELVNYYQNNINKVIENHLSAKKTIYFDRELRIKDILTSLSLDNSEMNREINIDDFKDILDSFTTQIESLDKSLLNNKYIIENLKMIEIAQRNFLADVFNYQAMRDKTLKQSLELYEEAKKNIEIINSNSNFDMTEEYLESYNDYKERYQMMVKEQNAVLDIKTKDILEELHKLAITNDTSTFYEDIKKLEDLTTKQIDDLSRSHDEANFNLDKQIEKYDVIYNKTKKVLDKSYKTDEKLLSNNSKNFNQLFNNTIDRLDKTYKESCNLNVANFKSEFKDYVIELNEIRQLSLNEQEELSRDKNNFILAERKYLKKSRKLYKRQFNAINFDFKNKIRNIKKESELEANNIDLYK